jgi:ribonuclease BN (tRNA processing enzyme)
VEIILLPSSVAHDADESGQYLTSFLLGDAVAIDAGAVGLFRTPAEQARIRHVFLSHSHMDHVASLPILVDNTFSEGECVTVHGGEAVLDCLRRDLFNDRLWPDFLALSSGDRPFIHLSALTAGQPVEVAGFRITPVPVNHTVPTLGFIVDAGAAAVVVASDTGPTEAIWKKANATANLKAVFLEAAFPNAESHLADVAKHLTPASFAREVAKLDRPVPVIAVHIKARYRAQVAEELLALGLPQVEIGVPGKVYRF